MTWDDQRIDAMAAPPAPTPNQQPGMTANPNGFRRAILTAGMAAALLVTGGTAIVLAASPEPSASTAPSTNTDPSAGGSTTALNGSTQQRQGHAGQPCPNDGNGSGGSGGSSGSGGGQTDQPTPTTPTPAT